MFGPLALLQALKRLLLARGRAEGICANGDVRLAAGHLACALVLLGLDVFGIGLASAKIFDADSRHLDAHPALLGPHPLEAVVEHAHPSLAAGKALGCLLELVARLVLLALAQRAHALETKSER